MKRLSLISLFWLVAVVGAFLGGRASMDRKFREAEQRRRDLELSTIEYMGYKLHSDDFAKSIIDRLAENGTSFVRSGCHRWGRGRVDLWAEWYCFRGT